MVGNSFQMIGAATEKARLPRFSFVLGIESCWEVDDRSCLGMLEKWLNMLYRCEKLKNKNKQQICMDQQ